MYEGERPRKPSRVIVMVIAFWIAGSVFQTLFGLLINSSGLVAEGSEVWMGRVLGWGLLFAISWMYREQLDTWLRRR